MIGILVKDHEKNIVAEFFELFKTPWEFYDNNHFYDVLIITANDLNTENARLIISYGSENNSLDKAKELKIITHYANNFLRVKDTWLPLYGHLSEVNGKGKSFLQIKDFNAFAGLEITSSDKHLIRIGYNLFDEVSYLLSTGQPPENALIPSLDLHISILRSLILNAGIPLLEIPPVPAGHNFIACLTHDIDFIRIRDHKFDHTMWGFLYRATIGSLFDFIKSKRNLKELYQNWKAVFMLPLVYLGLCRDFWFKFDRYMELEKNVAARSTFFLIPFKNKIGKYISGKGSNFRAAKYDIMDIQDTVKELVNEGFEVGVHGIDAWHNTSNAQEEKARISNISGKSDVGIRMHWLCFNRDTYKILEEAGFKFDSTFGYNDAVGYRAGTSQAFRPAYTNNIFELPLHIQDTALFNPKHMSLNKNEAWKRCQYLIKHASYNGGILTVLWHDRSLSPERLYEDFYIKLLNELKKNKGWFATATDTCNWFKKRRAIKLNDVKVDVNNIYINKKIDATDTQPSINLRIYQPLQKQDNPEIAIRQALNYTDIPYQNEIHFHAS
jgi:hypothetical protein